MEYQRIETYPGVLSLNLEFVCLEAVAPPEQTAEYEPRKATPSLMTRKNALNN